MTGLLGDKVILITGGSRGIGKECVERCAREGAVVSFTYNQSEQEARSLAESLVAEGLVVHAYKADVSNEQEVKSVFRSLKEKHEVLDVLINNAGVVSNNLLLMTTDQEYHRITDTNCKGVFLCTRAAAKLMLSHKKGKIINLASIVGVYGNSGQVVYSASKAFVIGLTRSAAKELGPYGITVNAIAPGLIDTDMTRNLKDNIKNELMSKIALGRIGTPKDIADVALFLCSDLSNYISGQVIGVDGCQGL